MAMVNAKNIDNIRINVLGEGRAVMATGGQWVDFRADAMRFRTFIESFLNPEERGLAVPAHVRDDAREILGRKRVESKP